MYEEACTFNMWLRPDANQTFDLKFYVNEGRGMLRISRPGVLEHPPASEESLVTGLSLADLHATRFFLLPRRGNRRHYQFSDLDHRHIAEMLVGSWNPLEPEIIDGQRSLLPPNFSDDETSLITTSLPLEAMRPTISNGSEEEVRLREEVRRLTVALAEAQEQNAHLQELVESLDRQLQQVQALLGEDAD